MTQGHNLTESELKFKNKIRMLERRKLAIHDDFMECTSNSTLHQKFLDEMYEVDIKIKTEKSKYPEYLI